MADDHIFSAGARSFGKRTDDTRGAQIGDINDFDTTASAGRSPGANIGEVAVHPDVRAGVLCTEIVMTENLEVIGQKRCWVGWWGLVEQTIGPGAVIEMVESVLQTEVPLAVGRRSS